MKTRNYSTIIIPSSCSIYNALSWAKSRSILSFIVMKKIMSRKSILIWLKRLSIWSFGSLTHRKIMKIVSIILTISIYWLSSSKRLMSRANSSLKNFTNSYPKPISFISYSTYNTKVKVARMTRADSAPICTKCALNPCKYPSFIMWSSLNSYISCFRIPLNSSKMHWKSSWCSSSL